MGFLMFLVWLAVMIAIIGGWWKVFTKAGKPGWAAIIPFYNMFVLVEIVGRPVWWFFLLFIPFVNVAVMIVVMIDLAKSFGQSVLYGIGLAFLGFIFLPLLGWGDAQYQGPAARA